MPKRSYEEKIELYNNKIRKLEEKEHKRRRRIVYSSDSDAENSENEMQPIYDDPIPTASLLENMQEEPVHEENVQDSTLIPDLDPDILSALGEATEDSPKFGEKIHDKLAHLWLPILQKGLEKEAKDKLIKQFLIPENCCLLQAPKLNPEIAATISDITKTKDKRVESAQQQLGLGITALNRGLSLLLENDTEQFNKGGSYGTINSHRSALSLFLGGNIGSDDSIKRLLKGIYKQKPCIPKYVGTWDPQIVLSYIANWYPNQSLALDKITKKLCVLLAICTAHRVQTLSLIKVSSINKCADSLQIPISDIIKTSAVGREQPVLILPYFRENPRICPATTLEDYMFMTSGLRPNSVDNLLLTYKKPYKKASSQSISRWIKQTLADSGVDVGVFSAHSTRHASTSAAASAGVSIDTIRKTAGWSSSSQTFARFYNRQVLDKTIFARSVCSIANENENHM